MFENLSPEQLRIALVAAYGGLAAYEVEIRNLRTAMALLWDEGEQYKTEGRTDHLTGTLNRKGVEIALAEEMSFAQRFKSPLSVIAIDVDQFKKINDTYGHHAGDAVLKEIVRRLRKILRPYDPIVRMGGDEFYVILRGATPENATLVAQRLCAAIALSAFSFDEFTFPVTISLGVAEAEGKQPLATADKALYEAKHAGRNRVIANKR